MYLIQGAIEFQKHRSGVGRRALEQPLKSWGCGNDVLATVARVILVGAGSAQNLVATEAVHLHLLEVLRAVPRVAGHRLPEAAAVSAVLRVLGRARDRDLGRLGAS